MFQNLIKISMVIAVVSAVAGCGPVANQTPASGTDEDSAVKFESGELPVEADGNWPSFRGLQASGLAVTSGLPETWDVTTGANLAWRTVVPGLGHSSPAIWDNRLFVTTAVGSENEPDLRIGLYGESPDNPEPEPHEFKLLCLDRMSGELLWERTGHTGSPQVERHVKASHANCTAATDGQRVIAFFGSEGLFAYDMDGNELWQKSLGFLDAGAFDVPEIQWGFGNSPILVDGLVIVLCDVNNQSFIAAFDADSGEERWRTDRDEVPTWGTPTVVEVAGVKQVIVNGYKHIGAYDLATGEPIWWMKGGGDIPVPTPIIAHGLVFITNSHGRQRPIYAIRLDAQGDISLADDETSNEFVVWSDLRRGAYMPTPIVVGGYLYVLADNGVLTCYEATTGKQLYRERVGGQRGAYTASPVSADGRIYITEEHGTVHVVAARPTYEYLGANPTGAPSLATPAIVGDTLYLRTSREVLAIRDLGAAPATSGRSEAGSAQQPAIAGAVTFEPPSKPPVTAVGLLEVADAAAEAVSSANYRVEVRGEEGLAATFPQVTASVTASGVSQGLPKMFVIEATVTEPGGGVVRQLRAGSDGDRFYLVDHATKTIHSDFDVSIFGPYTRSLLSALVLELHVEDPFAAEIEGRDHKIKAEPVVHAVPCWAIQLSYAVERRAEVTWSIGKSDYLPRERIDLFDMPDGSAARLVKTLSGLIINAPVDPKVFAVPAPDGYTISQAPPS